MKDNYTYPVIFDYSEPPYTQILFPDFGFRRTEAAHDEDPVMMAQEWLALTIGAYEDEGIQLPAPGTDIHLNQDQKLVFINIWMPYHRSKEKVIYTKKTLTIPQWLDILAKESNINFSETLTEALKEKLHIKS
ncbi:MAG TPA: type II toxin-antitoxin system HicB family antitoxin [Lachnospiraceae bacterium]|nr:type II toxin-antitoxin system HicB family antitoxin [Lachnospiraceae bacterium]